MGYGHVFPIKQALNCDNPQSLQSSNKQQHVMKGNGGKEHAVPATCYEAKTNTLSSLYSDIGNTFCATEQHSLQDCLKFFIPLACISRYGVFY